MWGEQMDYVKLSEICEIQSGGTPSRRQRAYWNGDIPWVKISDFSGRWLNSTEETISQEGLENSSAKIFTRGTILFTIFATLGEVTVLNIDACTNQAIAGLKVVDNRVVPEYLYYYLCSLKKAVNDIGRGVAQNNINMSILRNLRMPLKTTKEQEFIAKQLDWVTEILAYRKQQLSALDTLIKARFVEMFGDPVLNYLKWPTKLLLEMGYCKNGMNFHASDSGIEIHCLGVGDFKDNAVIDGTDTLPTISLNKVPPKESVLQDGDIVFVRSNGNKALVGRCLVIYPRNTPTTYSGFCIRYRLTSGELNTTYLLYVLKTNSMRKKMLGRGANIQNLNQQILATLDIPMPPIELQKQFAEFVEQVNKSKVAVQKALNEAQTLFDSLMQEYFG